MSITRNDNPSQNLYPANNLIPVSLDSDNKNERMFNYLVDVVYKQMDLDGVGTDTEVVTFNGESRIQINFDEDHDFKVGDFIYVRSTGGQADGLTKVLSIVDSATIIVDIKRSTAITGSFEVYKVFRNKLAPRPDTGYGTFDASPIVSNFVNNKFDPSKEGVTMNNDAIVTTIDGGVKHFYHEYYNQKWEFDDNYFSSSRVGFIGTDEPPMEEGDDIIIEQDTPVYLNVHQIIENAGSTVANVIEVTGNSTGDVARLYDVDREYNIKNASNSANNIDFWLDSVFYNSNNDVTELRTFTDLVDEADPTNAECEFLAPQIYDGRTEIEDIYQDGTDWVIETQIPYQYATPAIPGTIRWVPKDIKPSLEEGSRDNYSIFDGALLSDDYRNWDSTDYEIEAGEDPRDFLKSDNIPDDHKVMNNSYVDILFFTINTLSPSEEYDHIRLETTNKNSTDGEYIIDIDTSSLDELHTQGWTFHCGPQQLKDIDTNDVTISGGTLPIVKDDDTVEYTFWIEDDADSRLSEKMTIKIFDPSYWKEDECRPYELKRLLFKDRYGSYQGYLFKLLTSGNIQYERSGYRDGKLKLNNNKIDNRSSTRGLTDIYNRQEQRYILTTDYIDEEEFEWLKELLDSPEVYLEYDEYGELVPVNLDLDEVEIVRDDRRELQNVEITVIVGNEQTRQRN